MLLQTKKNSSLRVALRQIPICRQSQQAVAGHVIAQGTGEVEVFAPFDRGELLHAGFVMPARFLRDRVMVLGVDCNA